MPGLIKVGSANVLNTYSSSDLMNDFVYRKLSDKAKIKRSDVIDVTNDAGVREMLGLNYIVPGRSEMWLFQINLRNVSVNLYPAIMKAITTSETGIFWFKADRPREFFKLKEAAEERHVDLPSLWLEYYDDSDVDLIIGDRLSYTEKKNLRRYYGSDVSTLFKVEHGLREGYIEGWQDITSHLGVAPGYSVKMILDICKGYNSNNPRKIAAMVKQLEAYTKSVGTAKAHRELRKMARALLQYKVLYMRRIIYDRLPTGGLSEEYDERSIKLFLRWQRAVEPIPLAVIGALVTELDRQSPWFSFNNVLEFIYQWYGVRRQGKTT